MTGKEETEGVFCTMEEQGVSTSKLRTHSTEALVMQGSSDVVGRIQKVLDKDERLSRPYPRFRRMPCAPPMTPMPVRSAHTCAPPSASYSEVIPGLV